MSTTEDQMTAEPEIILLGPCNNPTGFYNTPVEPSNTPETDLALHLLDLLDLDIDIILYFSLLSRNTRFIERNSRSRLKTRD